MLHCKVIACKNPYYMRNPRKFAHPIPHVGTLHHPDYFLSEDELSYHIYGEVAA